MASALDKKLLRDLLRLKGQVLSIALVIASGIALLVMSLSTLTALSTTSEAYYDRYRFGHVFATVKRAPAHLQKRIDNLDGVQSSHLRITKHAILEIDGFVEPLLGRLVSIPEGSQPSLNRLVLRSGRLVELGRPDEVVINHSFAEAHDLRPGDTLQAIVNQNKRTLEIVGTAQSPEFIYVIAPFALMPDKKRYGILWMGQEALEAAFDYDGAFNDLTLTVLRGTDTRSTIQALDQILAPFGGTGAIDRTDHISSWFVDNELKQNRTSSRILPTIFILVAAFLTNTVLTRLISTERSEIGLMKAFGYSNFEVGWHYAKFVLAITGLGIVLGWGMGAWLGRFSTASYATNLNFPFLIYRPGPSAFVIGALISIAIGLLATARAVRSAATLAPSVAMSPPAPPSFRVGPRIWQRINAAVDEPTRIVLRQISRWPGRAAVTTLGFAGAIAMMVLSLYFTDAVDEIAYTHFNEVQREDVALGFTEVRETSVIHDVGRLPGVLFAEPLRIVSADLLADHLKHRGTIHGVANGARLNRIYDVERGALPVPDEGVVLTRKLAEKLGLGVGDQISVNVLEGSRPQLGTRVVDVYDSHIGMFAYMNLDTLNTLLGDRPVTQYVTARIDSRREVELLDRLRNLPAVSTVALKSVALENFYSAIGETLMIMVGFFSAFSFALGFGVSYNAQRIALSERGRELATLRVLGFKRFDALYILLAETTLLLCLALPLGCVLGWAIVALFVNAPGFQTELMRLPLLIDPSTYGMAMIALLGASAASGLAMKLWIDRLDLIAVLKTRE